MPGPLAELPEDSWESRDYSIFVLGAGFSAAAGLPLASELWNEIRERAAKLEGRAEKFQKDVQDYIEYRAKCDGKIFTFDTINFEDFLGYLDLEFHLGLRGKDTWSVDGNETQVVVKTLIGQILAERMPTDVPDIYLNFARRLKPSDYILTFNYDVLLERALDQLKIPYRLFPHRYKQVSENGSAIVDNDRAEVVILKLHGSIDWFDRGRYRRREEAFRAQNAPGHPVSPIFNPESRIELTPLLSGPRHKDDPLREVFRVNDIDAAYSKNLMFLETPLIIPPSSTKVLWFDKFKDFWWGMDSAGSLNFRMAIIGLSLAPHDDYARQIIYWIARNYQEVEWGKNISGKVKRPLLLVDRRTTAAEQKAYQERYGFVDRDKAHFEFTGFDEKTLERL